MAKADLPKALSATRADILIALDQFVEPCSTDDVRSAMFDLSLDVPHNLSIQLNGLARDKKFVKVKKKGHANLWSLTPDGVKVAAGLLDGTVGRKGQTERAKPGAKKPKKAKAEPAVATAPAQVNISSSADNLADSISAVLEENAGYRDLLLKIHDLIGKSLQLSQER